MVTTTKSIWYPAHAVEFSLATGKSACALLALRTFEVREEDGVVWLRGPVAQDRRA
jgi:nitrite reductase/ring-hydroxylating ferredoxin subunit